MRRKKLAGIVLLVVAIAIVLVFVLNQYTTLLLSSGNRIEFGGQAGAQSEECLTGGNEYLTSTADYIVVGTVTDVQERYDLRKGLEIISTINVEKYEKGNALSGPLQFVRPSGQTDNPVFKEGERVRFYLKQWEAGLGVLCNSVFVEK